MKLLVMSDLHVEFKDFKPNPAAVEECDVVVLAGDIHKAIQAPGWARSAFGSKPIVMVAGNHEFYRGHWDVALEDLRSEAREHGVHFLENDALDISGVRFLGCTLWVDFDYFGADARPRAMARYEAALNDCRLIKASPQHLPAGYEPQYSRLTAQHVRARHQQSIRWLQAELTRPTSLPRVVVTHHLPLRQSVASKYLEDDLTPGFASELPLHVISKATLWVHGHTHDSVDYQAGGEGPRVVCNPRGYPLRSGGQENARFSDELLIDV